LSFPDDESRTVWSILFRVRMDRLLFNIFEGLDISTLKNEECMNYLYCLDILLDEEESPECFIRYQLIKTKIQLRLREINKTAVIG